MPSPTVTITFKLQDIGGGSDAAAQLVVTLCNYGNAVPRVAGTSILADVVLTPAVAGDGTGSFTPWGNDVITPGPNVTFYMVQVKNAQGGVIQANAYQFGGSGSFDLSSLAPMTAPSAPVVSNAVVTNPTGTQTIIGFPLVTALSNCVVNDSLAFAGATSGQTIVKATAVASGTLTLPAATDTLVGKATTDTLTNKTLNTSGTGNHVQIAGVDLPASIGSSGQVLTNNSGALAFQSRTAAISYVIDGVGNIPSTGAYGQLNIPFACTLTGWVLTADASGSAVIDVLRSTYAGFPTTSSIAGTDKPTLSSVQKNENLGPLSSWGSTALSAGDQLQFNLNSVTTCKRLNLTLNITMP